MNFDLRLVCRRPRLVRRRARRAFPLVCCLLLGGVAWTGVPAPVSAQVSNADAAAVLLRVAQDFEREGRWDVAQAIYEHILERFPGTPSAVAARDRLTGPAGERIDRTSRVELPVFGALYGLWLGIAVPSAFGSDDSEAYGAGLLVGGPLGLFSARAYARSRSITEGQARAISWGGTWGTFQGYGWTEVLNIGQEEVCEQFGCFQTGNNTEELWGGAVVGGLTGIVTGALLARSPVRSGVSSAAQGGATWGAIYGAMTAEMFDPDGDHASLTTALLAGNVGMLAGVALAKKYDVSRPRVRMINLGAIVGGLGGLGIDLLVDPDDDEVAIAIPLITSVGGLIAAAVATRNDDVRSGVPGGDLDAGSALFAYRDGTLSAGTPVPMPTLLPMDDANGRPAWRPGLTMELFRARF